MPRVIHRRSYLSPESLLPVVLPTLLLLLLNNFSHIVVAQPSSLPSIRLLAPANLSTLINRSILFVLETNSQNPVCFEYVDDPANPGATDGDSSNNNCATPDGSTVQMRIGLPHDMQSATETTMHSFRLTSAGTAPLTVSLFLPPMEGSEEDSASESGFFLPISAQDATASDYAAAAATYASRTSAYKAVCSPTLTTMAPSSQYSNGFQPYWLLARLFPNKPGLTFVESGAADIYSSVTHFFERYLCWTGLGVEPIKHWAASSGYYRPGMLLVNGALCAEPGATRGFVEDANPYLSGFRSDGEEDDASTAATTVCHKPKNILSGIGLNHIDLFVLDCEGCEINVLQSFYGDKSELSNGDVMVDVWVVEGNDFADIHTLLTSTGEYVLLTCIGSIDAVFVRRGWDGWNEEIESMWRTPIEEKCWMFFQDEAATGNNREEL
jgi:hypothetical protein